MIKLEQVELYYGGQTVLDRVNFMLGDTDRVGLVGENGSGKTSLLKLIAGLQEPDRGKIEIGKTLEIGYLPQAEVTHKGRTLEEEISDVVRHILSLETERGEIEKKLEAGGLTDAEQEALIHRHHECMDLFINHDGYEIESKKSRVLRGLGFKDEDRARMCETFSGGWQMRIALAKLLLAQPSVLILDEPTNHLDLDARNWLEEFLNSFPGAFLIVSHDRWFLDVTVKRIVEIEEGEVSDYRGNYSYYVEEKERRQSSAIGAYERQQEEIQKLKNFIAKYHADKKRMGQVHSRRKMLDKIVPIEMPRYPRPISIRLPSAPHSPQEMVRLRGVAKSYNGKTVIGETDLVIFRGQKVAVVGPNGSGKSTLMKIITGRIKPDRGEVIVNHGIHMAYFDQGAGDELDPELSVLDTLAKESPLDLYPELRGILGAFLFSGDDVEKKVGPLSGGEKSRLALARLLLRPANLLLLDEPTNHLDLKAKEVLMKAFKKYSGGLVFVAHDRYFLEDLPDVIIEVKDNKVRSFIGDYSDYLTQLGIIAAGKAKDAAEASAIAAAAAAPKPEAAPPPKEKGDRIKAREEDRERRKQEGKKQKKLTNLEKAIAENEEAIARLDAQMSDPRVACDYQKLIELEAEKNNLLKKNEELYADWDLLENED